MATLDLTLGDLERTNSRSRIFQGVIFRKGADLDTVLLLNINLWAGGVFRCLSSLCCLLQGGICRRRPRVLVSLAAIVMCSLLFLTLRLPRPDSGTATRATGSRKILKLERNLGLSIYLGAIVLVHCTTLLKTFKESDFQSHIFRNILEKILPDCSPV